METQQHSLVSKYLSKDPAGSKKETIAILAALDYLSEKHPAVAKTIIAELRSQRSHLKMIASENYSSLATQLSMGNWLTDKYAEGVPGKRFYAGCEYIDEVETRANELLKKIFNVDHAYCQPHSGADANLIAYWSILIHKVQNAELEKLGTARFEDLSPQEQERIRQLLLNQKIMGLSLGSGGHLTHGYVHNLSSKFMFSVPYDVDKESHQIDYHVLAQQVKKERPLILVAGYSAYPRRLNFAKLKDIADSVGAVLMVDMAHFAGLVAGKVFQGEEDPAPYADFITSTSHKTLRGPRGGFILCKQEFSETVNKGCPLVMGGPLPHVMAAKAIAFEEATSPDFVTYAHQIVANSQHLAEKLKQRGLSLTTHGTDNHLLVIDVSSYSLNGKQAEVLLREAGITVNRNAVPFETQPPWLCSGLRLGTAALTTLGMKESEMEVIADIIVEVLANAQTVINPKTGKPSKLKAGLDPAVLVRNQSKIKELLSGFPLYPEIEIDN